MDIKHVKQLSSRIDELKAKVSDFWNDKNLSSMNIYFHNEVEYENIRRYTYERDLPIFFNNIKKYKNGYLCATLVKL